MMGGHIKESSKYVQQYAAMLHSCTKIWELHPERSQFTVQVGRKFSEGYPVVAVTGDNIGTFSSVTFTPQLWYTGDLKWYYEVAGDLGAASNFPSSILKQCHSSRVTNRSTSIASLCRDSLTGAGVKCGEQYNSILK